MLRTGGSCSPPMCGAKRAAWMASRKRSGQQLVAGGLRGYVQKDHRMLRCCGRPGVNWGLEGKWEDGSDGALACWRRHANAKFLIRGWMNYFLRRAVAVPESPCVGTPKSRPDISRGAIPGLTSDVSYTVVLTSLVRMYHLQETIPHLTAPASPEGTREQRGKNGSQRLGTFLIRLGALCSPPTQRQQHPSQSAIALFALLCLLKPTISDYYVSHVALQILRHGLEVQLAL